MSDLEQDHLDLGFDAAATRANMLRWLNKHCLERYPDELVEVSTPEVSGDECQGVHWNRAQAVAMHCLVPQDVPLQSCGQDGAKVALPVTPCKVEDVSLALLELSQEWADRDRADLMEGIDALTAHMLALDFDILVKIDRAASALLASMEFGVNH